MSVVAFAGQHPGAVLFDIDGVLLDSGSFHQRIWRQWAKTRSLDPAWVVAHTFGPRVEDILRAVAPDLDPVAQQVALDELVRSRIGQVRPMPGAHTILRSLNAASIPWAVVSSGSRWFAHQCFDAGRLPLPPVQVYGEDVRRPKPAPEGYLLAARTLGVPPALCAVVEDTPQGVMAAKSAGCTALAVCTTHEAAQLTQADVCLPTLTAVATLLQSALGVPDGPGGTDDPAAEEDEAKGDS